VISVYIGMRLVLAVGAGEAAYLGQRTSFGC
jgi:hypothetical protein